MRGLLRLVVSLHESSAGRSGPFQQSVGRVDADRSVVVWEITLSIECQVTTLQAALMVGGYGLSIVLAALFYHAHQDVKLYKRKYRDSSEEAGRLSKLATIDYQFAQAIRDSLKHHEDSIVGKK